MVVLKAKLKISCSSTTFIKEVFAVDERIRNYNIIMLHYQSTMATSEPRPRAASWPTGHRPSPPCGGITPTLARPVRPERTLKHRAPATPSTRPLSLPLARSDSLQHHAELAVALPQPLTADTALPADSSRPQLLRHHLHPLEPTAPPTDPR